MNYSENNKFWKYAICNNVPEILAEALGFEPVQRLARSYHCYAILFEKCIAAS